MSNKHRITIGIIVAVVVVVAGLLHWGNAVYWSSDGQRGWSLGVLAYELLGWDAADYRSDFGRDWDAAGAEQLELSLLDDDGDAVPDRGVVQVPSETVSTRRSGRWFGLHSFGRGSGLSHGGGRLIFLALLIGLGIFFFHRRGWKIVRSQEQTATE